MMAMGYDGLFLAFISNKVLDVIRYLISKESIIGKGICEWDLPMGYTLHGDKHPSWVCYEYILKGCQCTCTRAKPSPFQNLWDVLNWTKTWGQEQPFPVCSLVHLAVTGAHYGTSTKHQRYMPHHSTIAPIQMVITKISLMVKSKNVGSLYQTEQISRLCWVDNNRGQE